jgi:hypothetical protein
MSDNSVEAKISELSAKVDSFILGHKIGGLAILIAFSIFNLADTFAISRFRQIFADALPGAPLPALTVFFLNHQTSVTFLAVLWPILGMVVVAGFKKPSSVMVLLYCFLILVIIQIVLNWTALFTPLVQLTSSISNSS